MAYLNGGIDAVPGRKLRLDHPCPIKCDGDFEAKLIRIAAFGDRTSLAAEYAAYGAGIRLDSIPAGVAGWTLDPLAVECRLRGIPDRGDDRAPLRHMAAGSMPLSAFPASWAGNDWVRVASRQSGK
jgi:hypothetical protein